MPGHISPAVSATLPGCCRTACAGVVSNIRPLPPLRAGVSTRQASLAHSFMCLTASTAQLRALTDGLQANAHYVYSEAAPAHVRAGLSDAQLEAFPSLYAPPDQAPPHQQQQQPLNEAAAVAAYPRIVELTTLGGLILQCTCP